MDAAAIATFIGAPQCNWIALPLKDRRRGSAWLCRSCGTKGKGRDSPSCPVSSLSERPTEAQQKEKP